MTTGVISAHRQNFGGLVGKNLFQTDASINRGNSGGPLLNERGTIVGVNSMIARQAQDGLTITDVNFSIKSNVALKWLKGLGYRFSPVEGFRPKPQKKVVKRPPPPRDKQLQQSEEPGGKGKKPSRKEKILTKKNPYNMDELVAGMQEMEDLMEEMRGRVEEFRKRRR